MKSHFIVLAESTIGSHQYHDDSGASISMYSLTFPITIGKYQNRYEIKTNILMNKTFLAAHDEYVSLKNTKEVYFLLAQDLDENGEVMSETLKNALIHSGVDEFKIFRIPLTEKGYISIKEFCDTSGYKEFLYHQQQVSKLLERNGLPKLSLLKIMALKSIIQYRGKHFSLEKSKPDVINPNGTSTATFIHNFIMASSSNRNRNDTFTRSSHV